MGLVQKLQENVHRAIWQSLRGADFRELEEAVRSPYGRALGSLTLDEFFAALRGSKEPSKMEAEPKSAPANPRPRKKSAKVKNSAAKKRANLRRTVKTSPTKGSSPKAKDAAVLATVKEAGDWVSASAVREKVGKSPEQVRVALQRLGKEGFIEHEGYGKGRKYRLKPQQS